MPLFGELRLCSDSRLQQEKCRPEHYDCVPDPRPGGESMLLYLMNQTFTLTTNEMICIWLKFDFLLHEVIGFVYYSSCNLFFSRNLFSPFNFVVNCLSYKACYLDNYILLFDHYILYQKLKLKQVLRIKFH